MRQQATGNRRRPRHQIRLAWLLPRDTSRGPAPSPGEPDERTDRPSAGRQQAASVPDGLVMFYTRALPAAVTSELADRSSQPTATEQC